MSTLALRSRFCLLAIAVTALGAGCAGVAPEASDAEASPVAATSPRAQTRTFTVSVPVTAATFGNVAGWDEVALQWSGLAAYAQLDHELRWAVALSEGSGCDEPCVAAVIARAAARDGKLAGRLRVTRRIRDVKMAPGTCARVLVEDVVLDLRDATRGILPEHEGTNEFLTLVDLDAEPLVLEEHACP